MQKPNKFIAFIAYWREVLKSAKDAHEMISWIFTFAFASVAIAGQVMQADTKGFELLKHPVTQWGSIIIAVLLALRSLLWMPFKKHQEQEAKHSEEKSAWLEIQNPKFIVLCDSGIGGCSIYDSEQRTLFLRMAVKTESISGVKNCRGYLTKIEGRSFVYKEQTFQLPFAPASNEDSLSKTLHPNITQHLDVMAVTEGNEVLVATKGGQIVRGTNGYSVIGTGEYVLTVAVSGEGVPTVESRLKFSWSGSGFNATLKLIDESQTSQSKK